MAFTERAYFFSTSTSGDGSVTYTQTDLSEAMRIMGACNGSVGVARGYLNAFAATAGTNIVTVDTGAAIVDGHPYSNLGAGNVAIPSAAGGGNTRIDRVVARCDWAGHTVRLTRIAGTDAGSPVAPAITQTPGTTYDVPLWQVTVNTTGVVTVTLDERIFAAPGANEINTAAIQAQAVTAAKIANATITGAQIAATTIAGGNLAANTVDLGQLALNSVDDTIVGNRVPQFYRRQGGDASVWAAPGTTAYIPAAVRMQAGSLSGAAVSAGASLSLTVTFPVVFSQAPLVWVTPILGGVGLGASVNVYSVSTTQLICYFTNTGASLITNAQINWLAIGPE